MNDEAGSTHALEHHDGALVTAIGTVWAPTLRIVLDSPTRAATHDVQDRPTWSTGFMKNFRRACLLSLLLCGGSGGALAQSLTVNVDVFGLSENQFDTRSALQDSCTAITAAGDVSAAAADLLNTCAILNPLDDEDPTLAAGLNRLVPEEAFSLSDSMTDAADAQVSNVLSRITTLRRAAGGSDTSSLLPGTFPRLLAADADDPASSNAGIDGFGRRRLEVFFTGQLSDGRVDGADVQQDADLAGSGFTLGADFRVNDGLILGAGLGYSRDDTVFSDIDGGTSVTGIDLTLFATYLGETSFYADVVLDVGTGSIELERQIGLPGSPGVLALGATDSSSYSLTVGLGRSFVLGGWDLGPHARLGLTRSTVDPYSERASADTAGFGSTLRVGSQKIESGRLTAGAHVSRAIGLSGGVVVPQLSVDLEFEAEEDKDAIDASFLADPEQRRFSIEGSARDRQYMNLGLGTTAVFSGGRSAYVFYETRLQHDFVTRHWLKAGARLEF